MWFFFLTIYTASKNRPVARIFNGVVVHTPQPRPNNQCLNDRSHKYREQGLKLGLGYTPPEKKLDFEILKLLEMHWTCQFYHHHVILYHIKLFTIVPSGGPFWLLEGGGGLLAHHAAHPLPTGQTPQSLANSKSIQSYKKIKQFQGNEFWTEIQDLWVSVSQSGFFKQITPLQLQTVTWLEGKNLSWKNVSLVLVLWSLR